VGGAGTPFTALTGVLGHGEQGAPPHPEEAALARLLLERGANPNDDQTLYNREWSRDDGWLELLFAFGLGTGDGGPWARLLGDRLPSPRQMLENALVAAAHHGFADRVRLLLAHGVDPAGMGTQHPAHGGRAPIDEAALLGHLEIVDLLAAAGAQLSGDEVHRFVSICMAGDRARAAELRSADPTLGERAIARHPDQLIRAAEKDGVAAVELLIELGFDVNARSRTAPLHEAAMHGNAEIIRLLLDNGADPNVRDGEFRCPARRLGEASRYDRRRGAARAAHARAVTGSHRSSSKREQLHEYAAERKCRTPERSALGPEIRQARASGACKLAASARVEAEARDDPAALLDPRITGHQTRRQRPGRGGCFGSANSRSRSDGLRPASATMGKSRSGCGVPWRGRIAGRWIGLASAVS